MSSNNEEIDAEAVTYAAFLDVALRDVGRVSDLLPLSGGGAPAFYAAFSDGRLVSVLTNLALLAAGNCGNGRGGEEDDDGTGAASGYTGVGARNPEGVACALKRCRAAADAAVRAAGAVLPADVAAGRPAAVLAVVRPLVAAHVRMFVSIRRRPESARLLSDFEDLDEFYYLPAEDVLRRWVNHHLAASATAAARSGGSGCSGDSGINAVTDLGAALRDGRAYAVLLQQLDADSGYGVAAILDGTAGVTAGSTETAANAGTAVGTVPAQRIIAAARALGVVAPLARPAEIARGEATANVLLLAQIFMTRTGLPPLSPAELRGLLDMAEVLENNSLIADIIAFSNGPNGGPNGNGYNSNASSSSSFLRTNSARSMSGRHSTGSAIAGRATGTPERAGRDGGESRNGGHDSRNFRNGENGGNGSRGSGKENCREDRMVEDYKKTLQCFLCGVLCGSGEPDGDGANVDFTGGDGQYQDYLLKDIDVTDSDGSGYGYSGANGRSGKSGKSGGRSGSDSCGGDGGGGGDGTLSPVPEAAHPAPRRVPSAAAAALAAKGAASASGSGRQQAPAAEMGRRGGSSGSARPKDTDVCVVS
ncbi:unnamed protein product [Phaeothamnion confervicola]